MQVKIMAMISLAAVCVCAGTAAYADGIAVKEARTADFAAENYARYLQNYRGTQVDELILPSGADAAAEAARAMGINAVCSYAVSSDADISALSWDKLPNAAYGMELDFVAGAGNDFVAGAAARRSTLTQKLRELKAAAGEKKLYVKVPRDMAAAYDMGLDIYTWSDEKLCDVIEVSHTGAGTDTDMPIKFWRNAVDEQIGIYGVIGGNTDIPADGARAMTLENTAALANAYLSGGADKIYLDNFGIYDGAAYEPLREGSARYVSAAAVIIRSVGSLKTLAGENKRYTAANSVIGGADASQNYNLLPLELTFGQYKRFAVKTGSIPENAQVRLILGVHKGDAADAKSAIGKIYVNTKVPAYECTADNMLVDTALSDGEILVYSVDAAALGDDSQVIELLSYNQNVTVDYAELRVFPENDGFIYKNLAKTAAAEGRNILNADAGAEYTYTVTAKKGGIYAVGLCYSSDTPVGVKLNGREYTLPAGSELTAHGFAAVMLAAGENTLTLSADSACVLNYMILCRADISANDPDGEIAGYKDGTLTVNCGLSGLLDGQELMLIAAVYEGDKLVGANVQNSVITSTDYVMTMPVEASGGDSLRVYLWNNADKLVPYADVKIY